MKGCINLMKKVFDSLYEDGLLHVISDAELPEKISMDIYKSTAVAVNLYYKETLNYYFSYIDNIPNEIIVYIISSNELIWKDIEKYAHSKNNIILLKKQNRGRDISALLVAFRQIALSKKYICFIHDKKEISEEVKEDVKAWIHNLWDNTLKSEVYINHILNLLQKDHVGLLAPPKPLGSIYTDSYTNSWGENVEAAKTLIDKLKLNCELNFDIPPIILGTVFWCKTSALKKLWDIDWQYEDFPEEPLPKDGTINHAIERVLPYIVQDAGYTTEIIMNKNYSEMLLLKLHKNLWETYDLLNKTFNIDDINALRRFIYYKKDVKKIFADYKNVYLYGAGKRGKQLAFWIEMWGYKIDGFLVTEKTSEEYICGVPVYRLQDLSNYDTIAIIISVSKKYVPEIVNILSKSKFNHYYVLEK